MTYNLFFWKDIVTFAVINKLKRFKIMKKFFLAALCAIGLMSYSNNANAQLLSEIEGMPPYKLGITVGMNSSNFSAERFDPKFGYNLGVDLMLDASELLNNTYLRVNLLFNRKGSRFFWANTLMEDLYPIEDTKVRVGHLEIPVTYGYAYRLNQDWSVFGEMGPYFSWGLGGHYHSPKLGDKSYMSFYDNDLKVGNKVVVASPKRLDIGWGFAVGGMLWNQHQFKIGYEAGFINMNDAYQQNRNLMINYTYFIE